MAEQLVNHQFGHILPSPEFSLLQGILMSSLFLSIKPQIMERNPPNAKVLKPKYDFIVVGAGTAGAVVANRLSENTDFDVLLLEAGGDEPGFGAVPAFASKLENSQYDWNYTLGPNLNFCLGNTDKTCPFPRGKILGGTSSINGMVYVRGNKKDYDNWASEGNYGWSFEELLPYFKKSEENRNYLFAKDKRYHSTKGELTVSDLGWKTPLADDFLKAGQELGYCTGDYNARNQTVFAHPQVTVRDGYRCSTNKAFLAPVGKRKNLDIAKKAHVTKILINPATKRAFGVRFFRKGGYHDVLAKKEIILSAGVINTPQLLMLSGVGPKDHLEELNIPLIKDLPVGFNLQDHSGFLLSFVTDKPVTYDPERFDNLLANMTFDLYKKGPLTSVGIESFSFVNSKFQDPNESYPDLQIIFYPSNPTSEQELGDNTSEKENVSTIKKEAFALVVSLSRPQSRGRIQLRTIDPFDKPIININYFDVQDDVDRLADGGKIALKLLETKPFKEINARYKYDPIPICPDAMPPSDEYFECYMRYFTKPNDHAVGTAKMGPDNDPTTVVDPELRVLGISGLRVADASIMPRVVSGNTMAPTIMIGEKASDLIKNFWKNKKKNLGIH